MKPTSKPTFTCSKSTVEMPEQFMKSVQSYRCSGVFIVNFKIQFINFNIDFCWDRTVAKPHAIYSNF